MKERFQRKHGKITVLACYSPTNNGDDDTKTEFYAEPSRTLASVSPDYICGLLGDFKGIVRDNTGIWRGTIGHVTPHLLNDNALPPLELYRYHELVVANTYFQRKTIPQYKKYSNDGHMKKNTDYVILSKHWRLSLRNCRSHKSVEHGNADNKLLCIEVQLRLKAQRSETRPTVIDVLKLKELDTKRKYAVEVSNRFKLLQTLTNSEDAWKYFKTQTHEAVQLILGKKRRPKKVWISEETSNVIELRRKARQHGDMMSYRKLNGIHNKLVHLD
ncbi:uncharacterized protein LOC136031560 [Artemia franciscana]|uniref:uncharacterized protein LOC136031560 n=1 Tax=Artemia franciscana TaxID=6661 RepID=UPI0032DAE474